MLKEFDKKFKCYPGGIYVDDKPATREQMIEFIDEIYRKGKADRCSSHQETRQQERERIIEMIWGMKRDLDKNAGQDIITNTKKALMWHQDAGYHKAILDIINQLKES